VGVVRRRQLKMEKVIILQRVMTKKRSSDFLRKK